MGKKKAKKNRIPLSLRRAVEKKDMSEQDSQVIKSRAQMANYVNFVRNTEGIYAKYGVCLDALVVMLSSAWKLQDALTSDETACSKGCVYCCHVMVECSIPEVIAVYDYLMTMPGEIIEYTSSRVSALVKMPISDTSWWRENQACCVFLDTEGSCAIYDFRPLRCRAWNSMNRDVCISSYQQKIGLDMAVNEAQRTFGDLLSCSLDVGSQRVGLKSHLVELFSALNILLERPRAIDDWLAGEDVFSEAYTSSEFVTLEEAEAAVAGKKLKQVTR